ncbi:MAG: TIGR03862 family flavoprotein [Pseudomonadota bacterium]
MVSDSSQRAIVIGGGPAGLMAAEVLAEVGIPVDVFDAMPSVGRKFLMAGKGGMNITHSEPFGSFASRYGERRVWVEPLLRRFDADALRAWIHGLGIETFVGSSGRVFPSDMKAAPLLRAWLHRLRESGVHIHVRHRWLGWTDHGGLRFATPDGEIVRHAGAVIFALGGGSWARLGSDGAWAPEFARAGVNVAPLQPSNCGFETCWSEHLRSRFAGSPVKPVVVGHGDAQGRETRLQGEIIVTEHGLEGGVIYALSAALREAITAHGEALIHLDLLPGRAPGEVREALAQPRGARSMSDHLRRKLGLEGVKAALLRECLSKEVFADTARLAEGIKALPVHLHATRPIDEAISTAGGVRFEALDERLMLRARPGVFCAGEMLDWEAPTGGYLLSACFASGRAAGQGAAAWLHGQAASSSG